MDDKLVERAQGGVERTIPGCGQVCGGAVYVWLWVFVCLLCVCVCVCSRIYIYARVRE